MPVSSIFMPLHQNVMKFLRELCLVLTEICRSFIAIVTMKVRVCFPQLVTEIQFRSPYLFSIMQFLAIPLYQMWQFHYTKCGNSVIPNVDCSATIRGTLHEGGLEPSREILEAGTMTGCRQIHLDDDLHMLREAFLSDEERKERGHPDCPECPLIFHHNGHHPKRTK